MADGDAEATDDGRGALVPAGTDTANNGWGAWDTSSVGEPWPGSYTPAPYVVTPERDHQRGSKVNALVRGAACPMCGTPLERFMHCGNFLNRLRAGQIGIKQFEPREEGGLELDDLVLALGYTYMDMRDGWDPYDFKYPCGNLYLEWEFGGSHGRGDPDARGLAEFWRYGTFTPETTPSWL